MLGVCIPLLRRHMQWPFCWMAYLPWARGIILDRDSRSSPSSTTVKVRLGKKLFPEFCQKRACISFPAFLVFTIYDLLWCVQKKSYASSISENVAGLDIKAFEEEANAFSARSL